MTPKSEALRRIAIRALEDAEQLPPMQRAQVFEDAAYALPAEEAEKARLTAFAIRESERFQADFLNNLK